MVGAVQPGIDALRHSQTAWTRTQVRTVSLFVLFVASVKSSAVRIVCGAYSRGAYFSALGRLGEIETAFERKWKWPRKANLVLLPNARRNGVQ